MKAYMKEGGSYGDIDKLKFRASGIDIFGVGDADTIGADCNDITSELLEASIRLTHPDRHPPERQEAATDVTKKLVALKPFTFPEPKPEPPPKASDTSVKVTRVAVKDPLRPSYPCGLCVDQIPYYYCTACKAKRDKIQRDEREHRNAKQREQYARRKKRRQWSIPPSVCATCGDEFKGKRKDAKYCSAACRQKAHRNKCVTASKRSHVSNLNMCNATQVAA